MPKYLPNTRFSDCWGSVGEVTFYHRDGVCFWRKRARPEFPGTLQQMEQLGVHQRALEAWRGLDHETQLQWNALGADKVTSRPPFDGLSRLSGHNLFVSAYHGFAQLGVEQVPKPKPISSFPVFSVEFLSAEKGVDTELLLSFRVKLHNCLNPSDFRLCTRVQLCRVGAGKRPGYMRSFPAVENCSSKDCVVSVVVPDYVSVWDLDLSEYTAHCRVFLIDSETGYRSKYQSFSFVFQLK